MNARSLFTFAFSCVAVAAQTTHLVNGPNLQVAIDAAAPGDILLVTGNYSGLGLRIDKPLHIHGQGGAAVSVFVGPIWIENIAGNLTLQNFRMADFRTGIGVRNCSGSVVIVGVHGVSRNYMTIEQCGQVTLDECSEFQVSVTASTLLLSRSRLEGTFGSTRLPVPATPAVTAASATVIATACTLLGGGGDSSLAHSAAQPGVLLANASLRVSGRENLIVAGLDQRGRPVEAIGGAGTLALDSRTTLQPTNGASAIAATVQVAPSRLPTTLITRAALGSSASLSVRGDPGDSCLLLGMLPGPRVSVPNVDGELWVSALTVLAGGALDAFGQFQLSFGVPADPLLRGIQFRWQAVTWGATSLRLSEPTTECHF